MKKTTLLIVFLLLINTAYSQEIVMDFYHENGKYFNLHNIVEVYDNTLIVQCPMFETYYYGPDIGCMFYKISIEGILLDSLLIPLNDIPLSTLFQTYPNNDELLLYGRFEQETNDSTIYFRMTILDKDLNILDSIETAIENQLNQETFLTSEIFIDNSGDIIASYRCSQGIRMLRIGLDGTIMDNKLITEIPSNIELQLFPQHTGVFSQSPLRYYFVGVGVNNSGSSVNFAYVLDSTFNVVNYCQYHQISNQIWFSPFESSIVPYSDSCYLFGSAALGIIEGQTKSFLVLAKFDRNHNLLGTCFFFGGDLYSSPRPIGIVVTSPDTIYYAYMTDFGLPNQLALACIDAELNVRWTRYFLEQNSFHRATCIKELVNGCISVGSYGSWQNPGSISIVVFKDNYDALEEQGISIRPYVFYPNPAQDELHLQYSPDIQPKQIELFDLQGHLVRSQSNGLENINLQGLSAGQYLMKVTLEDGKVFTDKLMKE